MNIKDYLKYYIGCRVLADDKDYGDFLGGSLIPNEIDQIYYDIHLDEWPEGEIMPFNDDTSEDCRIKPILRRVEDMTEEEMEGIWLLIFGQPFPNWGNILFIEKTMRKPSHWIMKADADRAFVQCDGRVYADTNFCMKDYGFNPHLITHYLLSNGFDLFGLIDAGLAIDSKTVNQ